MKISVFMDHIENAVLQTGMPLSQVLGAVKESGVDFVDLDWEKIRDNSSLTDALSGSGMGINSIYIFCDFGTDTDISELEKVIDFATEWGCIVMPIPGKLSEAEAEKLKTLTSEKDIFGFLDSCVAVNNMKKALFRACRYAEDKNVTVTIEDFDSSLSPTSRIYELLWFMENVPGLRMNFDTGNFVYNDEDLLSAFTVLKQYIFNVHCKDRAEESGKYSGKYLRGLASCSFGSGYLPVKEVISDLLSSGYEGGFSLEHFGMKNQLDTIRMSAENIKKFMEGNI